MGFEPVNPPLKYGTGVILLQQQLLLHGVVIVVVAAELAVAASDVA